MKGCRRANCSLEWLTKKLLAFTILPGYNASEPLFAVIAISETKIQRKIVMRHVALSIVALIWLTACSTAQQPSIVDYASVNASPPPEKMLGLWQGPLGGGLLTFRIGSSGKIASCMENGGYRHAGEAKYACGSINFDDGSRAQLSLSRQGELLITSPPGHQAAVLHQVPVSADSWCR